MSTQRTKIWGTPMWIFIHTFTVKVNEVFFIRNIHNIINIMDIVIDCIPCDHCKNHALKYIKKNNMKQIKNKQQFIDYFVTFHNNVNKQLGKQAFGLDTNNIYSNNNIWITVVTMYKMVVSRRTSSKNMLDAIYRKERMMNVVKFVKEHIDYLS